MSTVFVYEDRHGNVVDENGDPEPIDYVVDQTETIATHNEHLKDAASSDRLSLSLFCVDIEWD